MKKEPTWEQRIAEYVTDEEIDLTENYVGASAPWGVFIGHEYHIKMKSVLADGDKLAKLIYDLYGQLQYMTHSRDMALEEADVRERVLRRILGITDGPAEDDMARALGIDTGC